MWINSASYTLLSSQMSTWTRSVDNSAPCPSLIVGQRRRLVTRYMTWSVYTSWHSQPLNQASSVASRGLIVVDACLYDGTRLMMPRRRCGRRRRRHGYEVLSTATDPRRWWCSDGERRRCLPWTDRLRHCLTPYQPRLRRQHPYIIHTRRQLPYQVILQSSSSFQNSVPDHYLVA